MMPQLDVFHVVEDCVQALSLVDHLVGRDENELRVPVDKFLDEPWAGDPVDLDVLRVYGSVRGFRRVGDRAEARVELVETLQ